jgi:hypothetical protein
MIISTTLNTRQKIMAIWAWIMLGAWDHNKSNAMGKCIYGLRSQGATQPLNSQPSALLHIPTKVDVFKYPYYISEANTNNSWVCSETHNFQNVSKVNISVNMLQADNCCTDTIVLPALLIFGLFRDAFNNSDDIDSNNKMIRK